MSEKWIATKEIQAVGLKQAPIKRLIFAQVSLLAGFWLVLMAVDATAAKSAMIGGLIAVIPNAYFMHWAFRYTEAVAATQIVQSFYRGETGKFLLTSLLFAGAFILVEPLNIVVIFFVYIFMMALNWILALCFLGR